MKLYIVRNQNQPAEGLQSVHINVQPETSSIVASLLFSQQIDPTDLPFQRGGKTWFIRDTKTINFEALRNQREFADRTSFMIGIDWAKNRWSEALIPLYAVSAENKMSAIDLVKTNLVPPLVVGFNVAYEGNSFSDCDLTVNIPSQTGECYFDGLNPANVVHSPYSSSGIVREMNIFPHLSATGPSTAAAGEDIEFLVRVVDAGGEPITKDVTLYLEAVNGYLPKNRVKTSGGQATVKMMTVGLSAGDKVRLKAGFKFYSGAADAEVLLA